VESGGYSRRRFAWGGYAYIGHAAPGDVLDVDAGVVLLSGDDPATAGREDWDPMFARWPKWSESWIYAVGWEDGVASWTNLSALFLRTHIPLGSMFTLSLQYFRLGALEHPVADASLPYGEGLHRGDLLIARLSADLGHGITGHALYEGLFRGRYYAPLPDASQSGFWQYNWMRLELKYDLSGPLF
jgi:hypothetical protein